ncbi:MAG: glyoxylate/hydroxypyruvate reductase A [Rhizobiales bacterium 65-9]|nr:glyoxylate/hydroxypyruvate reductase A [Hyphomicrobiales bacterium]OJY37349.1 MAG: glyoxylate/hydroxypyruvate reductase A [Rhizobiales bacterium 65-9]
MTLLVAITGWDPAPWAERFRKLMPDRRVVTLGEPYDGADIRYVASWKHPPRSLANLPHLKALLSLGAGVDHLFSDPALPDAPIVRIVDPDLTARMSEYVVLHCLLHLRQQRRYDHQQRNRQWVDDRLQPAARDMRVGILGMGELGQDAARKLALMGFQVAGWSRSSKRSTDAEMFCGADELDLFLQRTDILVALLPLTRDTRGFINATLLRKLAHDGPFGGPYLINAGRGGLQVESDILACLNDGTLLGAALDVFEQEPLPPSSPLWPHPAVTITPHNAAMSDPETIGKQVVAQIQDFESGAPLRNIVDRDRQY